jgi:hypothetical protein
MHPQGRSVLFIAVIASTLGGLILGRAGSNQAPPPAPQFAPEIEAQEGATLSSPHHVVHICVVSPDSGPVRRVCERWDDDPIRPVYPTLRQALREEPEVKVWEFVPHQLKRVRAE